MRQLICISFLTLLFFPALSQTINVVPKPLFNESFGHVTVSNKGDLVAASFYGRNTISIFEGITGKEITRITVENSSIKGIYFLKNDGQLVILSIDKIELFDLFQNKTVYALPVNSSNRSVAFNQATGDLATAGYDSVHMYKINPGIITKVSSFPEADVSRIALSKDGMFLYCSIKEEIRVRQTSDLANATTIPVGGLQNFIATDSFLVVSKKDPYSFVYYKPDGAKIYESEYKKGIPYFPSLLTSFGDDFMVPSFGSILFIDNKGYQGKMKSSENFTHAMISRDLSAYVLRNWSKIQLINEEGNPMAEITEASYRHVDMILVAEPDKQILLNDSLLQFSKGDGKWKQYKLPASYGGVYTMVNGYLGFACTDGSLQVWDIRSEKLLFTSRHKRIPVRLQYDQPKGLLYALDYLESAIFQFDQKGNSGTVIKNDTQITSFLVQKGKLYFGDKTGTIAMQELSERSSGPVTKLFLLSNSITSIDAISNDILFSSFGRSVAVKSDLSDSASSRVFVGHNGYITAVSVLENKKYFATASSDQAIKLWDYKKQALIGSYSLDSLSADRLELQNDGIVFHGPECLMGVIADTVSIRNAERPAMNVIVQSPNNNAAIKMVINKQGELLATTDNNTVKVRDLRTGFMISEFNTREGTVNGITFSADGKMLAVATGNGIECFDPFSGKSIRHINLENSGRSIHDIEAVDNRFVGINIHGWHNPVYYHKNSGLYLGQLYPNTAGKVDKNIFDLKYSADGMKIATYGSSYIKLFQIENNRIVEKFSIPVAVPGKFYASSDVLDFSPDGAYLMYVEPSATDQVKIISTTDGRLIKKHNGGIGKFGSGNEYVYVTNARKLMKASLASEEVELLDASFDIRVECLAYNKMTDLYAAADKIGNIKLIEGKYGIVTNEINRWDQYTYHTEMSKDKKYIAFNNRSGLYLLKMENLSRLELPANNYPFFGKFSQNSDTFYFRKNNTVYSRSLQSGAVDSLFTIDENIELQNMDLSTDGKILYVLGSQNEVVFYDLNTRQKLWKIDRSKVAGFRLIHIYNVENIDGGYKLFAAGFTNYGKELGNRPVLLDLPSLKVYKNISEEIKYTLGEEKSFERVTFESDSKINYLSPGKSHHIYLKDLELYVKDLASGKIIFNHDNSPVNSISFVQFSSDESKLVLGFADGMVKLFDLKNRGEQYTYGKEATGLKMLSSFRTNSNGMTGMQLTGNLLLIKGANELVSLFDIDKNGEKLLDMVFIRDREQIFINKEGYYFSTKNAAKFLAFKQGTSILPFERFDYIYNRPDKIMASLQIQSLAPQELVEAYHSAWKKRVGDKPPVQQSAIGLSLPVVTIDDSKLKQVQYSQLVSLPISASGSELSSLQVIVNGVPFFGSNAFRISGKNWKGNIEVPLSQGSNRIKIIVANRQQVESDPVVLSINYVPKVPVKPDLYIITLSVSDYQSNNDLKYPQKDGRDIVKLFAKQETFQNVYVDTLFNNDATHSGFLSLKSRLLKAKPDDQVVVFLSGHGLLDKKYDFYFATYDCDFNDPAKKGISYQEIESLLDSIAPRKKLLLIDACHSGEFDKGSVVTENSQANQGNSTGAKGLVVEGKVGLENSFQLMQDLFANLNRGSGTVVISAAAGDELAFEADRWNNGVFTWAILNGLTTKQADLDRDSKITVSELRTYVYKKVTEETGGRQKPTTRQENLEFDWVLW